MSKDKINAYLGEGTIYTGKLSFVGTVRVDGQFTGEISSDGELILGMEANVQGDIRVNQLVLSGKIHGDVIVSGTTVMHKTANLQGTLSTKNLIMEEGAILQGAINMLPDEMGKKAGSGKTIMLDAEAKAAKDAA